MTQEDLQQLTKILDKTFDQKLKPITLHLEQIDKRLGGIDMRLDGMDKRFDGIDKQLVSLDKRLERVENEQKTTNEMVSILVETAGTHSDHEKLAKRVTRIEKHLGLSPTP